MTLTNAALLLLLSTPGAYPYSFPPYDTVKGLNVYADPAEYDAAVHDTGYVFEKLRTSSDELSIVTYLYRPAEVSGKKLPLIVFLRGSTTMGDQAPQLVTFFHRLASRGFVVLAPQYRGSDGGEGRDEVGGADLADVTSMLPLARSLGYVDDANVYLYGESRGGMMTYQAIRDRFPARAAVVFGAFTDLEVMNRPAHMQKVVEQLWPDYATNRQAIVERRSAKYWPEKLDVPLLIMNGTADPQVDASQALNLALQLQALKKEYSLVLYANGNHVLTKDRLDRDERALLWFEAHMKR